MENRHQAFDTESQNGARSDDQPKGIQKVSSFAGMEEERESGWFTCSKRARGFAHHVDASQAWDY